MINNKDGTYTYLIVPTKYNCIYMKLLIKLSDLGTDLIKDCTTSCKGNNKQIINCWNMFQAACAAYSLGEEKKSDLLINYINDSFKFGCGDYETKDSPKLLNFKLNIDTTITGDKTLTYDTAIFELFNKEYSVENSLTLYKIVGETKTIIASGLSTVSPIKFNTTTLNIKVGETHTWRLSIEGTDSIIYYSNDFIVTCIPSPKVNIMYYGNTDIEPQIFDKMSISDIMSISGNTPRNITGVSNNQFVIKQTKNIHYLLIPDSLMNLVRAEYGTVLITTLWDGTDGAYKTANVGGIYNGIHYNVFFLYTPIIFSDDIRITCKNK